MPIFNRRQAGFIVIEDGGTDGSGGTAGDKRIFDGYNEKNSSFLEKLIWKKKLNIFQNKISCVIAPSKWIENLAKNSLIFKNVKVVNIPYSIDPKTFYVEDKINALKELNIKGNLNEKFIIFI